MTRLLRFALRMPAALLWLLNSSAPLQAKEIAQEQTLAITHVAVIDGVAAYPKPNMTVVVVGDRIVDLGQAEEIHVPKDARVINGQGKFLIPGLWDMHTHWYGYDKAYLRLFIINGVTGVRIMWGAPKHFEWRREIEEGTLLGPRMIISSTILDGPKPTWPGTIGVGTEVEGRQAVKRVKQEEGADFVKVYSLLPREAYLAIADEAKKQGLPFVGHVPISVSAAEASDAGQKSMEHLTGVLPGCSTEEENWRKGMLNAFSNLRQGESIAGPDRTRPLSRLIVETLSLEKANALFSRLKRNHTWQCPTLVVLRSFAFLNDPNFRNDQRLKYMPAKIAPTWNPANDYRLKARTSEDYALSRKTYQKQLELVGMMHRAGVEFLAGTDVGNPYLYLGFSLHDELALLVEAGLTPMEALQAATSNPARFLDREKDLGTIEKGKLADLVLLEANPLEDIRNTKQINAVVYRGRLFLKPELKQMLAEMEAFARADL